MDHAITFARHFARLIGLLLHESGNIEEQKVALRGLVAASRAGPIALTLRDWQVLVNGALIPENLAGAQDLSAQMYGHCVTEIGVSSGASAADVLEVARALVREPIPGRAGQVLAARLAELAPRTVRVSVQVAAPEPESRDVSPDTGRPSPAGEAQRVARPSGSYLAFAAAQAPQGSIPELFSELERSRSIGDMTQLLDNIATLIEQEFTAGNVDVVADGLASITAGERARSAPGQKAAYTLVLRRLNRKPMLKAVALLLPRFRQRASEYLGVLRRMGSVGTEVLIDALTAADSASERRIFFDALVELGAGAPELLHMLGDPRWFVIRNAAELLGEVRHIEADAPLAAMVAHGDERVRRAVVGALARLRTPKAYAALRSAMRDESAQVRILAAAGLASRSENTSAHTLTSALAVEENGDVQLQIVATLGKVSTPDAVQQLVAIAESPGGWFKKTPPGLRVAAVEALGAARTAMALATLNKLRDDKDPEVRAAAQRAVSAVRREAKATG